MPSRTRNRRSRVLRHMPKAAATRSVVIRSCRRSTMNSTADFTTGSCASVDASSRAAKRLIRSEIAIEGVPAGSWLPKSMSRVSLSPEKSHQDYNGYVKQVSCLPPCASAIARKTAVSSGSVSLRFVVLWVRPRKVRGEQPKCSRNTLAILAGLEKPASRET